MRNQAVRTKTRANDYHAFSLNNPPQSDKDGFANVLKMVANKMAAGDYREAQLLLVDAIDTVSGSGVELNYVR